MKKKLTYQEIIDLDTGLKSVGGIKSKPEFSMLVARNRHTLKEHLKDLDAAKEASEDMVKFQKELSAIYSKYQTSANDGKASCPDEKWPELKAEVDEFNKKHKKTIDAYDEQIVKYTKLLKSTPSKDGKDIDIDLSQVNKSVLPKELTANQLDGIFILLKL